MILNPNTPIRAFVLSLLPAGAVVFVLLAGRDRTAQAFIDIPPQSLAKLCTDTQAIAVLRVEKVNREKRGIVYSKVRDLKGTFPTQGKYFGDTFTHIVRKGSPLFSPLDKESQDQQIEAILAWAAEGKIAVLFQRGGEQSICVGHSWYTARPALGIRSDLRTFAPERPPPAKEPWVYGAVCDSRFARFFCGDPEELVSAVTDLLAGNDTGNVKWRKEVPGGVLSSVAVKAGMAIFTATDGKVRAWDAFTGQEKWTYDAKAPFFAGPAVTKDTVYAADLKGVVHALNLTEGKREWTLDLGADPATKASGMVYGSPVIHRGRLYLATCNLGDRSGRMHNVVVCIGDKRGLGSRK